jgi:hypothetical protein
MWDPLASPHGSQAPRTPRLLRIPLRRLLRPRPQAPLPLAAHLLLVVAEHPPSARVERFRRSAATRPVACQRQLSVLGQPRPWQLAALPARSGRLRHCVTARVLQASAPIRQERRPLSAPPRLRLRRLPAKASIRNVGAARHRWRRPKRADSAVPCWTTQDWTDPAQGARAAVRRGTDVKSLRVEAERRGHQPAARRSGQMPRGATRAEATRCPGPHARGKSLGRCLATSSGALPRSQAFPTRAHLPLGGSARVPGLAPQQKMPLGVCRRWSRRIELAETAWQGRLAPQLGRACLGS